MQEEEAEKQDPEEAMQLMQEQRSINRSLNSLEAKISDGLQGIMP